MEEPDLIDLFVRPLRDAGLRYLVAGSLGSMLYSEPRLTLDIDLPVFLAPADLPKLAGAFPEPAYYCPPLEVLAAENERECRAHFNVIHIGSGYKADFYPARHDPFFPWAWSAKREVTLRSGPVLYAPPEYIILWKTAYYAEGGGEKHVRDIRRMLDISAAEIDTRVLEEELGRRRLLDVYRTIASLE